MFYAAFSNNIILVIKYIDRVCSKRARLGGVIRPSILVSKSIMLSIFHHYPYPVCKFRIWKILHICVELKISISVELL